MLQLKLVEESPSISQVRLDLHCPQEPLSGFGDLTLTPKQPKMVAKECIQFNTNSSIMPKNAQAGMLKKTAEKGKVLYNKK